MSKILNMDMFPPFLCSILLISYMFYFCLAESLGMVIGNRGNFIHRVPSHKYLFAGRISASQKDSDFGRAKSGVRCTW